MVRLMAGLALAVGLLLGSDAQAGGRGKAQVTGVVNLNQASPAQLDLLPGVGAKAVQQIIAHRQKAPFRRPEELVNVKGFGKKRFDKLKPHLAVSGPTTLVVDRSAPSAQARSRPVSR